MAATLSKRLSVKDLAREYGKSEAAIRQWLTKLEAKHPGTVKRTSDGPRAHLYVTLASLRRADPDWIERQALAQEELIELRRKTSSQQTELGAVKKRLREVIGVLEKIVAGKGQQIPCM